MPHIRPSGFNICGLLRRLLLPGLTENQHHERGTVLQKRFILFTISILIIFVTFSFWADCVASDEPLDLSLQRLEKQYTPKVAPTSPGGFLKLPSADELNQIETECGFTFPVPLRQLYLRIGNLGFEGVELVRAHGGKESALCKLIQRWGHADGIRFFADGGGHYAMNKFTGKIEFLSEVNSEETEIYPSLSAFLDEKFPATN